MNRGLIIHVVFVLFLSSFVFAEAETTPASEKKDDRPTVLKPIIRYIEYNSDIQHRYAKTLVSSNVANPANVSQEVHFSLVLPETAFISGFVMIIKEKEYEAYVKEKEKAKQIYNEAVAAGQSAAHIEQSVRDSNRFQVSVNVEAEGKVTFKLTYEELLTRTLGSYIHTVNVNPGQIVKNLTVRVKIEEPVAITKLKVPHFRTKNEVAENEEEDNPTVQIERDPATPNKAIITWSPTKEEQMNIASEGLQGQFVVEYDVDREKSSQILLDEGYFVHFFTPDSSAPSLSKHVVFILDISGSMHGRKIEQLKEAMTKILNDLHGNDYFSIILFSSDVITWSPSKTQYLFKAGDYSAYDLNDGEISSIVKNRTGNEIVLANPENINSAKEFIGKIFSTDATNIIGGLREGIKIANEGQTKFSASENDKSKIPQPIVVFLTDGEPNVDVSNPNEIVNITSNINEIKAPIYSLAFGDGADLQFLRRLSLRNYGFARNIYEASDAKLQLSNFYKEISSPLMADVKFSYLPGQVENGTLTTRHFPILFNGSEIVIAGKLSDSIPVHDNLTYEFNSGKTVDSTDYNMIQRCIIIIPHHPKEANHTFGHLEKLWAYLTIKQLLDKDTSLNEDKNVNRNYGFGYPPPVEEKDEKKTESISDEKKEALRLALKYSFVTPLTSLVVVKPNETSSAVDPEKASSSTSSPSYSNFAFLPGGPMNSIAGQSGAGGFSTPLSASFGARPMVISTMSRPYAPILPPPPLPPSGYYPVAESTGVEHEKQSEVQFSTPASEPPSTSTEPDVHTVQLESLSWLNKVYENNSLVIDIPNHGNYTVGFNQTDVSSSSCQLPNKSEQGYCRHLQYCALSSFATSIEEYVLYFCDIAGSFAGVCCPFLPPNTPVI